MHATRRAFQEAYAGIDPLLHAPELEQLWDSESALKDFSVRGLAGHLVRAGWAVLDYLAAGTPSGEPIPAPEYYRAVLAAMGSEEHEQVRTKGEAFAGASVQELRDAYVTAGSQLAAVLPAEPQGRTLRVFGGHVMRLEDYLETRIVEVLVHADDLAASLGVPRPQLPPEAFDLAIRHLVSVARLRHGDPAVLVALSRRERDRLDALKVF